MPSTATVLRRSQPSSARAVARDLTEPRSSLVSNRNQEANFLQAVYNIRDPSPTPRNKRLSRTSSSLIRARLAPVPIAAGTPDGQGRRPHAPHAQAPPPPSAQGGRTPS